MFNYKDYKIMLCCGATDMRKSINGLSSIVCEQFELEPRDKIIFAFCNRSRNRIKLLVWADNGFWIHFKRIEKGHICGSFQYWLKISSLYVINDILYEVIFNAKIY